jgi:hypothetical protein
MTSSHSQVAVIPATGPEAPAIGQGTAASPASPGGGWRRARILLLTGATAILLLGAVAAGVFGYLDIARGIPLR